MPFALTPSSAACRLHRVVMQNYGGGVMGLSLMIATVPIVLLLANQVLLHRTEKMRKLNNERLEILLKLLNKLEHEEAE